MNGDEGKTCNEVSICEEKNRRSMYLVAKRAKTKRVVGVSLTGNMQMTKGSPNQKASGSGYLDKTTRQSKCK
jgi:hypothetical protein